MCYSIECLTQTLLNSNQQGTIIPMFYKTNSNIVNHINLSNIKHDDDTMLRIKNLTESLESAFASAIFRSKEKKVNTNKSGSLVSFKYDIVQLSVVNLCHNC